MANTAPDKIVADAMSGLSRSDFPPSLQASIERESRNLMGLASTLLDNGMDEQQVKDVIDRAFASYSEQLVSAIFAMRNAQ